MLPLAIIINAGKRLDLLCFEIQELCRNGRGVKNSKVQHIKRSCEVKLLHCRYIVATTDTTCVCIYHIEL